MKESKTIALSGFYLAFIAGFLNAFVLEIFHTPVSHMTGALSHLGAQLARNDFQDAETLFFIIFCFFIGATISSMIIGTSRLVAGKRYGFIMILESFLLLIAYFIFGEKQNIVIILVAMVCGLQNAMASSYKNLIIRTTHMTGIITDLGISFGQFIRFGKAENHNIHILLYILFGFFLGAILAVWSYRIVEFQLILFSGFALFISGVSYVFYRLIYFENRFGKQR